MGFSILQRQQPIMIICATLAALEFVQAEGIQPTDAPTQVPCAGVVAAEDGFPARMNQDARALAAV